MIEGERGAAIVEQIVVLKTAGLIDSDSIATAFLGACLTEALRHDVTPRSVALQLWDVLPGDDDWEGGLREVFEQAVDEMEARGL